MLNVQNYTTYVLEAKWGKNETCTDHTQHSSYLLYFRFADNPIFAISDSIYYISL